MATKSLIETNPYLIDPRLRDKLMDRYVVSSFGVEGVEVNFNTPSFQIPHRRKKRIYSRYPNDQKKQHH